MPPKYVINDGCSLVFYIEDALPPELSDQLLAWYREALGWRQKSSVYFGKSYEQQRMGYLMGKDYSFSGYTHESNPFDTPTRELLDKMNELFQTNLNSALFWLYRKGTTDYIARHSDSKEDLKPGSPIVGLSLGDTVKWRLTNKKDESIKHTFENKHGTIFVMAGNTQDHWYHEVMKKKHPCDRISITMREFA